MLSWHVENQVCFIDYQGGMKGAMQYDAASLLWQAKSNLSDDWKKKLFAGYWTKKADSEELIAQYYDDVTLCLNLIDDLNLNTRIWSKRPEEGRGGGEARL